MQDNNKEAFLQLVRKVNATNNENDALLLYGEISTRFPNYPAGYLGTAEILLNQNELNQAAVSARKAVELVPHDIRGHKILSLILKRQGAWAELGDDAELICKYFPDRAVGYVQKIESLFELREFHAAIAFAQEARQQFPQNQAIVIRMMRAAQFGGLKLSDDEIRQIAELYRLPSNDKDSDEFDSGLSRMGTPPKNPDQKFLFVSGAPRSGTTALGELLNVHPEIHIHTERYAFHLGYHPDMFTQADALADLAEGEPAPQAGNFTYL
ncbi:MAG: sulfotransferase, partial [Henriciella sp.]